MSTPRNLTEWLAQFTPADESQLDAKQQGFVAEFRQQYPGAKVGTRDGRLALYVVDPKLGPTAMNIPKLGQDRGGR